MMMRQPQAIIIVPRTTANRPRLRPALPLKFAVKLLVWMRTVEEDMETRDVPTESVSEVVIDLILDSSKRIGVWMLSGPLVGTEGVEEVLNGLFGQVELVWAGVGKKGLFGARVGKSEGRGRSGGGLSLGLGLPLKICFLIIIEPEPEVPSECECERRGPSLRDKGSQVLNGVLLVEQILLKFLTTKRRKVLRINNVLEGDLKARNEAKRANGADGGCWRAKKTAGNVRESLERVMRAFGGGDRGHVLCSLVFRWMRAWSGRTGGRGRKSMQAGGGWKEERKSEGKGSKANATTKRRHRVYARMQVRRAASTALAPAPAQAVDPPTQCSGIARKQIEPAEQLASRSNQLALPALSATCATHRRRRRRRRWLGMEPDVRRHELATQALRLSGSIS